MTPADAFDIDGVPQSHTSHLQHAAPASLPSKESAINSITAMTYRRRAQGAAINTVPLYTRINPEASEIVDRVAERAGVSKAEFVEALILHLDTTLDERGVPSWWTRPIPEIEELDLHAS